MKKIFLSAALVMLFASPALAQSHSAGYGTVNVIDFPALEHGGFNSGSSSYAYEPSRSTRSHMRGVRSEAMSPVDPDTVYENGQYVGRDPDPNVRLELRRDWTHD